MKNKTKHGNRGTSSLIKWDDLEPEERIERLRHYVKTLKQNLDEVADRTILLQEQMIDHQHWPSGKTMMPIKKEDTLKYLRELHNRYNDDWI